MSGAHLGFDEVIHPQPRLSIMALLAAADWAEFGFIRDSVGLSDSALSKHLSTLEQAGYVTIRKTNTGRRRTHRSAVDPAGARGVRRPRRRTAGPHHRRPPSPAGNPASTGRLTAKIFSEAVETLRPRSSSWRRLSSSWWRLRIGRGESPGQPGVRPE
jgi:DNA-binding transcriptional ArsR family regulator